ncbi:hypothetical protein M3Y97_00770200 [Aphelenchoides bicaudatus]|nr:hypothetical protein M3Y97_00770200 [Aphelenchoides bicaudatus]
MHQFIKKKGRPKSRPIISSSKNAQLWLSVFLILFGLHLCSGLTSESRSELARKFKYYHRSVRPGDRFNLVDTINGTFFALHTEVELLQTRPIGNKLEIELMLSLYYNDERLILRDIQEIITIPDEFLPWIPQLEFPDQTKTRSSIHVDPRTGQISLRFRLHINNLESKTLDWQRPFQKNYCKFEIATTDKQFPTFAIVCDFRNPWLSTVVNTFMPAMLIFSIAVFSQWKRRKLQVLVTLGSLIGLILLKTAKDHNNSDNFDMEDLFLLSTLMHLVALLGIDLVLPARRIIRTTYTSLNEKLTSNSNHATFSTRSTEKAPIVTASYKDATQRFLRPFGHSNRSFLGSSEEKSVFLDMSNKLPPVHYDLSDIEMADEEADDDDLDLQRMRTTYIQHIRKPTLHVPTTLGASFTDTSPSINAASQKTQPTSSLSASATTVVTSPTTTTALVRRQTSDSPLNRSQQMVTKMTIGRKKRLALVSILGCYILFLIVYVFLVIFILG